MEYRFSQLRRSLQHRLQALYDEREAKAISWTVMEAVSGRERKQLMLREEEELPLAARERFHLLQEELLKGRPLQYVLGESWFYGLRLNVNASVLIPRPETEELVDWVIKSVEGGASPGVILDLGTGSGAIPIALKKHLPGSELWAADISSTALETATKNARQHQTAIHFLQMDMLDEQQWKNLPRCDIIVSNPPYVLQQEQPAMSAHVLEHEPHLALFVENEKPLLFYEAIVRLAKEKLRPGGQLFLEINEAYGTELLALIKKSGLCNGILRKDMQNKDRMIKAEMPL